MDEEIKKEEEAKTEVETKTDEASNVEQTEETEKVEKNHQEEQDPKDKEITELKDQLLRARAEFANYKRRTTDDMVKLGTYTTSQVVKEFLKVLDNFERAEQSYQAGQENALVEGLQKIRKQFDETLKKLDVEEIKALNQKFDPNLHEAVMRGENPELEEDIVDMVLEKGYKIREQVIRHSKVRVISNQ